MKARITHLKAPWPLGARVGDVVEFAQVPAWAAGKVQEVGDDEAVTLEFGEPVKVVLEGDSAEVQALKSEIANLSAKLEAAQQASAQSNDALMSTLRETQEAADVAIAGLNEQLLTAKAEVDAAQASAAESAAQVADLTTKLEAAQAKTGKK